MDDFCRYCCSDIDNYAHEEELRPLSEVCDEYQKLECIPIHLKTSRKVECSSEESDATMQLGLEMDATLRMELTIFGEELQVAIDEGYYGSDIFEPSTDYFITIAKMKIKYCPMCGRKLIER